MKQLEALWPLSGRVKISLVSNVKMGITVFWTNLWKIIKRSGEGKTIQSYPKDKGYFKDIFMVMCIILSQSTNVPVQALIFGLQIGEIQACSVLVLLSWFW